jgi:hypothetical protein
MFRDRGYVNYQNSPASTIADAENAGDIFPNIYHTWAMITLPKPSPIEAVGFLSKITKSLLAATGEISE